VLGLKVTTTAPYSATERWLTVVSPEDPDGVELVLHLTDEAARAFRQASSEIGRPVISLRTDDCAADAERLKTKGVVFVKEPAGWTTAAPTRSSTTPAATLSTSTRAHEGAAAMVSTSLPGSMRASLLGNWHQARPAQRLGYVVGGALVLVGVAHLLAWLAVGGAWQGPVSFRKPTTFGVSFGLTTITLAWVAGRLRISGRTGWLLVGVVATLLATVAGVVVGLVVGYLRGLVDLVLARFMDMVLSFLGLGVVPPTPTWGGMLSDSLNFYQVAWWFPLFPGLALLATTLAFNLLGDSVRDALDPTAGRAVAGGDR